MHFNFYSSAFFNIDLYLFLARGVALDSGICCVFFTGYVGHPLFLFFLNTLGGVLQSNEYCHILIIMFYRCYTHVVCSVWSRNLICVQVIVTDDEVCVIVVAKLKFMLA